MGSFPEFNAHLGKYEVARPYLFDVNIPIPPIMLVEGLLTDSSKRLMLTCESAELPGRTFATTTQKIYGPTQKFPVLTSYSNMRLTFICEDRSFYQKKFFDSWFEYINPKETFNFSYKQGDGYTTNIAITQYTQAGEILYKVRLIDAFPVDMTHLSLDWDSTSTHKLVIDFAYTTWEAEEVSEIAILNQPRTGSLGDLVATGIKLADIGYNINNAFNAGSTAAGLGIFASTLPSMGISNFTLSSLTNKIL